MKKIQWAQLEQNPSQQQHPKQQHFQYVAVGIPPKFVLLRIYRTVLYTYTYTVQYMEKIQFMFKVHIGLLKLVF